MSITAPDEGTYAITLPAGKRPAPPPSGGPAPEAVDGRVTLELQAGEVRQFKLEG